MPPIETARHIGLVQIDDLTDRGHRVVVDVQRANGAIQQARCDEWSEGSRVAEIVTELERAHDLAQAKMLQPLKSGAIERERDAAIHVGFTRFDFDEFIDQIGDAGFFAQSVTRDDRDHA
ncbi:hypothetical protein D3C87_1573060 [compost metagenome]